MSYFKVISQMVNKQHKIHYTKKECYFNQKKYDQKKKKSTTNQYNIYSHVMVEFCQFMEDHLGQKYKYHIMLDMYHCMYYWQAWFFTLYFTAPFCSV